MKSKRGQRVARLHFIPFHPEFKHKDFVNVSEEILIFNLFRFLRIIINKTSPYKFLFSLFFWVLLKSQFSEPLYSSKLFLIWKTLRWDYTVFMGQRSCFSLKRCLSQLSPLLGYSELIIKPKKIFWVSTGFYGSKTQNISMVFLIWCCLVRWKYVRLLWPRERQTRDKTDQASKFFFRVSNLPIRTAKPNSSVSSIPCFEKWWHVCAYTSRTRLFASTRK